MELGEEGAWVDRWMDGSWQLSRSVFLPGGQKAPAAVIGAGLVCEPFFYIHMCEILRKEIVPSPSSIGVSPPTNQPLLTNTVVRALCFVLAFKGITVFG